MNKNIIIISGLLLIIAVVGFVVVGSMFLIEGDNSEQLINQNEIELHLYPESFNNYCGDGGAACTSAYRITCSPYEYYRSASIEYNCNAWSIPGAERKLIGHFCTEEPILKIHSATANMYFEDWFGEGNYPPIYLGMTDNNELSNKNSTILEFYTVGAGTNYPERDVGLNQNVLTEYVKGEKCFNIYAVGGYYKKNSRSGMDATINYIDINYDPVECLENIDCNDNNYNTIDTCLEYQCDYKIIECLEDIDCDDGNDDTVDICKDDNICLHVLDIKEPTGLAKLFADLKGWIFSIFSSLFK